MNRSPGVLEPEVATAVGEDETLGPSGPRIRCPLCTCTPAKDDLWECTCGHHWNTFDTGGGCPACLHQWTSTQCLSCARWSAHSDWYAKWIGAVHGRVVTETSLGPATIFVRCPVLRRRTASRVGTKDCWRTCRRAFGSRD